MNVHAVGLTFSNIDMSKNVTLNGQSGREESQPAVPLTHSLELLPGLSGFKSPPPTVTDTVVYKGDTDTLFVEVVADIPNLSSLSLQRVGVLKLDCRVNGTHVGVATSKVPQRCGVAVSLLPAPHQATNCLPSVVCVWVCLLSQSDVSFGFGDNTIVWDVQLTRTPDNADYINSIISNYSSGIASHTHSAVHACHCLPAPPFAARLWFDANHAGIDTVHSTPLTLLQRPLSHLAIPVTIPGLVHEEVKMLQAVRLHLQRALACTRSLSHAPPRCFQTYALLDVSSIFKTANATKCPDSKYHTWQNVYLTAKNTHNVSLEITSVEMDVVWTGDAAAGPQYGGGLMATAIAPTEVL